MTYPVDDNYNRMLPVVVRSPEIAVIIGCVRANLLYRPNLSFPVWDIGANAIAVVVPGGGYWRWPIMDGVLA